MSKLECSRCGKWIPISVYIANSRLFCILEKDVVLHFCTSCVELIGEGDY